MTQLYKLKSSVRTQTDNLFSGIWIRWRAMTVGERFVCVNIVLIPAWWVVGLYGYMSLLLLLGVALYEWQQYGELRLKRPSLPVVALLAFGAYQVVSLLLSRFFLNTGLGASVQEAFILSLCPACWLWYIQSNNIRIRIEVVAWACTVSVVQMIGFWLVILVLPETVFFPPHLNLFARFIGLYGTTQEFYYLLPYKQYGNINNLPRFNMFFVYPEFFAVVAVFMGLVALEIKNRFWSWLLFLACVFLLLLSGTRIAFGVFPIVLFLRYLFSNFSKLWVPPIFFALIGLASFTTLTLPPTSDLILNKFMYSVQSIDEARADSTDLRLKIYEQTWKGIQEKPILGHANAGPSVHPQISFARVGTHSFILGRLLYRSGLVGTVVFIVFWISLFIWFYKNRAGRPLTCFCVLIFYTLICPTNWAVYDMPISSLLILLCAAIRHPKQKSVQGVGHA